MAEKQRDYAVAPGEFLAEWLNEENLTQEATARRLGWSRKRVNEVIGGRAPITSEAAIELERVTGITALAWASYEAAYRADLARLHAESQLEERADTVSAAVAAYLRQLGATKATARNKVQLVSDFLVFHRCGTVSAYEDIVKDQFEGEFQLATLKESANDVDPDLLMAWLRAGELTATFDEARQLRYDEVGLRNLLPALRARAATPDESLVEELTEMLRGVGVTLQVVAPPKRFPLHGVTRWIHGGVPLIQQTGRRGSDGFIIWTLFHELGHVLNDPRGDVHFEFTSTKRRSTHAEKAANEFAFKVLFGDEGLAPFLGAEWDRDIARVAKAVGVSPGLAVFQLHRTRQLAYNRGNRLCVDLSA